MLWFGNDVDGYDRKTGQHRRTGAQMQQDNSVKISSVFWSGFISVFPVVGLIYLIAASCSGDKNRRNIARGLLLLRGSLAVLAVMLFGVVFLLLDHII